MTTSLRSKGKNSVYWILLGFMVFGLGGYGITNFSGGRGQEIGSVGQTGIAAGDYSRALRNQLEAVAQQTGKRPNMAEAQQMGLDRNVQAQLFSGAALDEAARQIGLSAGDGEVVRQLREIGAFRTANGGFDRAAYADLLKREGLSEATFEDGLRRDTARQMLGSALTGATVAPQAVADSYTRWLTETRDLSVVELTSDNLAAPLPAPTEDELKTFHSTHADQFTRPETRNITYLRLTPEDLEADVKLDEAALRQAYDDNIDTYVVPERRAVEVLVYPDAASAEAARARLDKGEATFADLAAERGLTLSDIDRGEVRQRDLGPAGEAVFAAEDNGVVGPVTTDLGPALISVNAILSAEETSFEQARPDLAAEAAADQARRVIVERSPDLEDALASGASLEDVAKETGMKLGTVAFTADMVDGMAGYPSFRETAMSVTDKDFPTLGQLNDGGVFALRLDSIEPPALIPFDQVRDRVADAWASAELARALAARGEEIAAAVEAGTSLAAQGLTAKAYPAVSRDGFLENMPPAVIARGFDLTKPTTAAVAEGEHRVFVVALDRINAGAPDDEARQVKETVTQNLGTSISQDIEILFARAIQDESGMTIDPAVIAAANAQVN